MSRRAQTIVLEPDLQEQLQREAAAPGTPQGRAVRLRIVLAAAAGKTNQQISHELQVCVPAVRQWRGRFAQAGLAGLRDRPRSGKPRTYDDAFRQRVLSTLEAPPPPGQSTWDGPAVAAHLGVSPHAVWRLLRREGICLQRQRSWCVSTDPEFAAKAADIIGLYLHPPLHALVLSVDEKPSIQALERRTGYVLTDSGKIVRGFKSTYQRHGTLNLFAALEVATGQVHGKTTTQKRRADFRAFLDEVLAELPPDQEVHVILDNLNTHKKNDDWLATYAGRVQFHFTPTSASWLNLVEVFFCLLGRKALRGADLKDTGQLRALIEQFIARHNQTAKPFVWRKREVKGSQLRNTVVNLCN
jgi:transposase